jgi:hypothetical protein
MSYLAEFDGSAGIANVTPDQSAIPIRDPDFQHEVLQTTTMTPNARQSSQDLVEQEGRV